MNENIIVQKFGYEKEELLRMYHNLVRGRIFTLAMHDAVKLGRIRSSFHTPYGQEAPGVALLSAMREQDWLAASHRVQAAAIMRFDAYQYIAELFSRIDGYKKGTVFDYHGSDYDKGRMVIPTGVLGSISGTYTGFAWARRFQGHTDEMMAICLGDGACSEGSVYESWNLATLYKAPVLYVIENNGWAMTVPLERQTVNPDISDRAKGFGMPVKIVDGDDMLALRKAMDEGVALARSGQPNVVEVKCTRWGAHFFGQDDAAYRQDLDDVAWHKENRDCVKLYEDLLLENGLLTEEYIAELKERYAKEFRELSDKAFAAPIATKEDVFKKEYIYANVETGGDL